MIRLAASFLNSCIRAATTVTVPLALILVLSTSCKTLGPDYEEPAVEWLQDWQPDLYGQVGNTQKQTQTDLSFWWTLFNDPVLNRLIADAQSNNPGIRLAGLRIIESRAALGIANSTRYPQVQQIDASAAVINSQQIGGPGSENNQTAAIYDAAFNLGWELDFWGRFSRAIESANAAFFASVQNQRDFQMLLNAQIADLYYAYLTTRGRIAIAQQNIALQRRSLDITQRLFDRGQDSELNLQQAKTQYLATLSTIPALESSLIQIRNALAVVLGRPPAPIPELEDQPDSLPQIEPLQVQAFPSELLLRRPDIRAAAWSVAAQSAQIGIAEADYYPAISLFGSLGLSGSSLSSSTDTVSLAAGPNIRWNIFDYGRIENNVRLQDTRLQQAIENFQNQVLLAAKEIDDAAITL